MFQNGMSLLSGVLAIAGYVPYIAAILRGPSRPSKATWLIWSLLDTIVLYGMVSKHVANGQIVGAMIGAWIVFALSLKYGTLGWKPLDRWCLGGTALGLILWYTFDSPMLGMMTSLCLMFIGSFPTFVSAWKNPGHENRLAWAIYLASCMSALIAVPAWNLENAAQPATFSSVSVIMMYILFTPRKRGMRNLDKEITQ